MGKWIVVAFALVVIGCVDRPSRHTVEAAQPIDFGCEIEKHAKILERAGRIPFDHGFTEKLIGRFGYVSMNGGYTGLYQFHQPSYEQAQRMYVIHGVMEKGSNILRPVNRNANIGADVIGLVADFVSVYPEALRDLKIIGVGKYSDGTPNYNELITNQYAPRFAVQYNIELRPSDWREMCACVMDGTQAQPPIR